jgi:hypothetical protein
MSVASAPSERAEADRPPTGRSAGERWRYFRLSVKSVTTATPFLILTVATVGW